MQTQDQGFTIDHPIVGQNTSSMERTIYPLNQPGEALERDGMQRFGYESNSRRVDYTSGVAVTNEEIQYRSLNQIDDGSIVFARAELRDAYDYCGINTVVNGSNFVFARALVKIGQDGTFDQYNVTWTAEEITYASNSYTITPPAGEKIIAACQIRTTSGIRSSECFFVTTTGTPIATGYKLYFRDSTTAYLVAQVDPTLWDVSPHFSAYYNDTRYAVQSPFMDSGGPQYAWTTTTPTGAWAQMTYSAWLVPGTGGLPALYGTERSVAGRAQVGATIALAAVLVETAVVPQVGYTQGANCFNGPGFYTSLFTDTAGGASVQAMTGNLAAQVNTQATGAGITETILPDAVGIGVEVVAAGAVNTTINIKTKAANKKAAFICISNTAEDPGAPISEFGGYDLSFYPAIAPKYLGSTDLAFSGIIYAKTANEFEVVFFAVNQYRNIMPSPTRIAFNVFASNSLKNVVNDFNDGVSSPNFGAFVRAGVVYQGSWASAGGANITNIQTGNKYTSSVYLGAYTGTGATHPSRVDWLENYGLVYVYNSGASNGQGRKYEIVGTAAPFTSTAGNIDTLYLDAPNLSFVQNDVLPIPSGCKIKDGFVVLPNGIAPQAKQVADIDGVTEFFYGYYLDKYIYLKGLPFVIQGTSYLHDGSSIYQIDQNTGQADLIMPALGVRFIANSSSLAYFARDFDNVILGFDGGREFKVILSLQGLRDAQVSAFIGTSVVANITPQNYAENARIKTAAYVQATDDFWVRCSSTATIKNVWIRLNNGVSLQQFTNRVGIRDAGEDDWYLYEFATNVLFQEAFDGVFSGYYYSYNAGTVTPITYKSPYYGINEGHFIRPLKYTFRLNVRSPTTTDLVITYKWFTYDGSGTETYTFAQNTYVSNGGYVYLEYIPTQQVAHGASIGISSTKEIYILGITGHYGPAELALTTNQNPSTA